MKAFLFWVKSVFLAVLFPVFVQKSGDILFIFVFYKIERESFFYLFA